MEGIFKFRHTSLVINFSQKLKMRIILNEKILKIRKLFLHTFQNMAHLLGEKENLAIFEEEGGVYTYIYTYTWALYIYIYSCIIAIHQRNGHSPTHEKVATLREIFFKFLLI